MLQGLGLQTFRVWVRVCCLVFKASWFDMVQGLVTLRVHSKCQALSKPPKL